MTIHFNERTESKLAKKNKPCYTSIGGQAVIEGILMRGPKKVSLCIRTPDGNVSTEKIKTSFLKDRYSIFKVPVLRGIGSFIDSMVLGYKALSVSADKSLEEEEIQQGQKEEYGKFKKFMYEKLTTIVMVVASVLGVGLAIALFFMLPTWIYNLGQSFFGASAVTRSVVEGLMRIFIFIVYIVLCSHMKDIKRVFQYHGAEHKTIFCYEAKETLTIENVKKQSRFHPRCGTSFLIILLILGIIIGFFIPFTNPFVRSAVKILCIPLIVGFGFELIRICGKYDNLFTRIISAPGLWIQRITTKEPDKGMIEVAIKAISEVIPKPETDNETCKEENYDAMGDIQKSKASI